jgi:DNA-binding transcriptional regulator YiaG
MNAAMTPQEYKALRNKVGLTQEKLAWELHVSTSTISLRERGEVPIDEEAARALRHLVTSMEGT